jgi:hypothetical protein
VTAVLKSSSAGFWLTTVTDGLDIVRPPPVIATRALDACAVPPFDAAQAATDESTMHRRLNIPQLVLIPPIPGGNRPNVRIR